uniref:Protein transport protein sec16 n=1 Tax=Geotrypetes seraphini TaxID=260995 RepID=A0A6P8N6F9_GEOSA|nr:protein transport protein Sec16B [Geotrypetes seraphini]XP_033771095.1 protein transport protein Sec16B [Geotrypetes seraphini]XP_033771096.1 protein transport protein Sec16B [Geotrypetes seraphini]XP_033771097.1 protein transport protein Sec16B [Geotrypetes seraphini]
MEENEPRVNLGSQIRIGMDPGALLPHSQPQGRYIARTEILDKGPWRDGYHHRSTPLPRPNSEMYFQPLDPRCGPQPWLNSWTGSYHHHPNLSFRTSNQSKQESWTEYYEGCYPHRPYSRQGYEEAYQTYPAQGSLREDYYRGYYHRYPRTAQEDIDWRQTGSYDSQTAVYRDQSYYSTYQQEPEHGSFQQRNGAYYKAEHYDESYIWDSRQKRDGEELQRNLPEESGPQQDELSTANEPSLLLQYRDSGLSSSSYELSQYMVDSSDQYDRAHSRSWSSVQAEEDLSSTPYTVEPLKYSLPHVTVCFGAGGQLVRVCPNFPAEGQPALIEIHSLEVLLHDTAEQEEMRAFPGPLAREDLHKLDVMTYCQRKIALIGQMDSRRNHDLALLWQLLILLCRQNGTMVGSDIAELLMHNSRRVKYTKQETISNLINLTDEAWLLPGSGTPDLLTGEIPCSTETAATAVEKFTKLLFFGRKKEALELAMKSQLWGHALFLSSKMDLRTYSEVMSRFTNTLAINDPIQTLFQLMAGRIPRAATCCGDLRWEDWRPHLAVILTNQVEDVELQQRTLVAMGDCLAGKGLIEAAHFCYLMANVTFGYYSIRKHPLVLLGSSCSQTFPKFTSTESIQQTEIFEYCQLLRHSKSFIPSFQVYKLLYASRLADYGLPSLALHYCEVIGSAFLDQNGTKHLVVLTELIKLAERLKLSDPRLLERPDQEETQDPDWLIQLRVRLQQLQVEGEHDSPTSASVDTACASRPAADLQALSQSSDSLEDSRREIQTWGNQEKLGYPQDNHFMAQGMGLYQTGTTQHPSYHPGTYHMGEVPQEIPVSVDRISDTLQPGFSEATESPWSPENEQHCGPPGPGNFAVMAQPQEQHKEFGDGKETPVQQAQHVPVARIRSISESSAISVEDEHSGDSSERDTEDTQESLQGPETKEAASKTGSGYGWFGWFRSKPVNTAGLSKKSSSTGPSVSDSSLPDQQEMTAALPPPPLPPPVSTSPSSHYLPPPLHLFTYLTLVSILSLGTAGTKETKDSTIRRVSVSGKGEHQEGTSNPSPAFTPLPLEGTVPLFNPQELSTARSNTLNQPRRLSQRRYPTQPPRTNNLI